MRLALIAGPTASGKSARALEWAERENGTIINADASQIYRDLRIVSARPSAEEEALVPHCLYGHRDGAVACSAADWAEEARAAIAEAAGKGRLPILVGGTGLYLRTLLDGIAPVPTIDPAVRAEVRALAANHAHAALAIEDPAAAASLHPNDTARCQRALEVIRSTSRSILAWRGERVGGIRDAIDLVVEQIDLPIPDLYARCDARAEAIVKGGGVEEVAVLLERRLDPALPVMRAIGVASIAALLAGEIDVATCIATLAQDTRNYAKRQRTWLRHQPL